MKNRKDNFDWQGKRKDQVEFSYKIFMMAPIAIILVIISSLEPSIAKQLILFVLGAIPMILEAFIIDPAYWKRGKSDKPMSTIIRVVMTIVLMVLFGAEMGLIVLGFYMFFDFLIGWRKHRNIFYTGKGKWDRFISNIPNLVNVFFRVLLTIFLWAGYFYIDNGNTIFNPLIDWLNSLIK